MTDISSDTEFLVSKDLARNYFRNLVNQFFKILPMRENNESSLDTYMRSLQLELAGCKGVASCVRDNPMILSLISILQYLIDNDDCSISEVRREVFKAISMCNKLKSICCSSEVSE